MLKKQVILDIKQLVDECVPDPSILCSRLTTIEIRQKLVRDLIDALLWVEEYKPFKIHKIKKGFTLGIKDLDGLDYKRREQICLMLLDTIKSRILFLLRTNQVKERIAIQLILDQNSNFKPE